MAPYVCSCALSRGASELCVWLAWSRVVSEWSHVRRHFNWQRTSWSTVQWPTTLDRHRQTDGRTTDGRTAGRRRVGLIRRLHRAKLSNFDEHWSLRTHNIEFDHVLISWPMYVSRDHGIQLGHLQSFLFTRLASHAASSSGWLAASC